MPRKGSHYRERPNPEDRPGKTFGRPPGTRNTMPPNVKSALERLNEKKFRVRTDIPEDQQADAGLLAGWARERICDVVSGACHSKKAPSYIKGSIHLLEETTEPIVKAMKLDGSLSLASAVAKLGDEIKNAASPVPSTAPPKDES